MQYKRTTDTDFNHSGLFADIKQAGISSKQIWLAYQSIKH